VPLLHDFHKPPHISVFDTDRMHLYLEQLVDMADGFYSTDWENQGQGQGQYSNQGYSSYDPNAFQQQNYANQGYNDQYSQQSYGGDMYTPGKG